MIENYSITEWIAFFFIYSFLGWCIESAIVSFNKRKLTNRGFLKGPMLPLYGSGAVIMLLSTLWAKDNYVLVYICGTIGATALEYVTGVLMEMMFNMRYWDYSNKKFQIHGYLSDLVLILGRADGIAGLFCAYSGCGTGGFRSGKYIKSWIIFYHCGGIRGYG